MYHRLTHLRSIAIGIVICVVIWTVSLLGAGTPYAVYSRVVERGGSGRRSCRVRWPWEGRLAAQRAWTYGHLLIGVVAPLVCIAAANTLLLRRLRSFAGTRTPGGTTVRQSHHPGDEDPSVRRQRASQNMARLVLAIVTIFVICQLPYHIIEVLSISIRLHFDRICTVKVNSEVYMSHWVAVISVSVALSQTPACTARLRIRG